MIELQQQEPVALTVEEAAALQDYEATIAAGLQTFTAVGTALLAIRDGKLYRAEHKTFEAYCAERWSMSRPRAYQLIEAAAVVQNLSTMVDKLPVTERQARPLTPLDPDTQRQVWQQAVDTAPEGKITAAHVQATVEQFYPRPHDPRQFISPDHSIVRCDICDQCYDGNNITFCPYCAYTPDERQQYVEGLKDGRASMFVPEQEESEQEEQEEIVARGEKEILEAAKRIRDARRDVRREEVIARLGDIATQEAKAVAGVFDVLVIDPPWPMEKIERDVRPNQVAFDYPTMSTEELRTLTVPAATDCHVWLWTTHRFLPLAFELLQQWEMRYVCTFVWHKPGGFQPVGLPQYNCEFALYARKGSPVFLETTVFPVCFHATRGAHSEKPEEFYEMVRRVTGGRRLDMFARRTITGFERWGKEADICS